MTRKQASEAARIENDTSAKYLDGSRWPGRKVILVSNDKGEPIKWGEIYMEQHGSHGSSYWFKQEGEDGAIAERTTKRGREIPIKVWGDKQYRLYEWDRKSTPLTLRERLLAKVCEMILAGKLRHPKQVAADQAREHAHWLAERAAEKAAERTKLEAKARDVLDALTNSGGGIIPDATAIPVIVAAMEWAQTQ
jgi:hypothetical protein